MMRIGEDIEIGTRTLGRERGIDMMLAMGRNIAIVLGDRGGIHRGGGAAVHGREAAEEGECIAIAVNGRGGMRGEMGVKEGTKGRTVLLLQTDLSVPTPGVLERDSPWTRIFLGSRSVGFVCVNFLVLQAPPTPQHRVPLAVRMRVVSVMCSFLRRSFVRLRLLLVC
jgi:hypothetical protein